MPIPLFIPENYTPTNTQSVLPKIRASMPEELRYFYLSSNYYEFVMIVIRFCNDFDMIACYAETV